MPQQETVELWVRCSANFGRGFIPLGNGEDDMLQTGDSSQLLLLGTLGQIRHETLEFTVDFGGVNAMTLFHHGVENHVTLRVQCLLGNKGLGLALQRRVVLYLGHGIAHHGNTKVLKHHHHIRQSQQECRQVGVPFDRTTGNVGEVPRHATGRQVDVLAHSGGGAGNDFSGVAHGVLL